MRDEARAAIVEIRRRCVHLPLVTFAAMAAVLATANRYHVFTRDLSLVVALRYGYSGRALSMGHWGTLVTSQFLTRDALMAVSIALSLVLMLGVYEMVVGTTRAIVVTVVGALAGPLLVAAALGIGSALGWDFAVRTLSTLDYGASAVTACAGGALIAVLGMRRLRRLAVVWVIGGVLLHHQLADWEHVGSFVVGYGLGRVLGAAPATTSVRRRFDAVGWTTSAWAAPATGLLLAVVIAGGVAAGSVVPDPTALSAVATSSPPRVVALTYPAPSIGGQHDALLTLPAGYDGSRRRYPVVEMLHGTPGAPADIITGLDPIGVASGGGIPPFIGVAPDGHGPALPVVAFADVSTQHLGTAISDDLRRFVDRHYRTNGDWNVTGLSSGGYGAAYLGSRKVGQYRSVCAMSGNFVPKSSEFAHQRAAVLRAATPLLNARRNGPRTLLVAGRADHDSMLEARAYARALQQAGESHRVRTLPGGHTWSVWARALPMCLRFMLSSPAPTTRAA